MSDVPVWTCEFAEIANESKMDHLTVGDRFRMSCRGDIAVPWSADVPSVKMPKSDQDFTLAVLSAEKLDPQSVQLTVTGYRPGDHAPDFIRVLQGERGFEVEKPKWKIESVIQPSEKPPQPYPSEGYSWLRPPWWFTALGWLAVVLVVVVLGHWIRRWYQRRRFREELARHRTALSPTRQFYRDARQLRRRLDQAAAPAEITAVGRDLNRDVRLLLMRQFEVPALVWTDAALVKEIERRRHGDADFPAAELRKLLRELTRAVARESLSAGDVDQLIRMGIDLAEATERSLR